MSADTDRAVGRFVLVALVLPAIVAGAGLVVQLLVLPHAPAHIVLHRDAAGSIDRATAAWVPSLLTVLLGLGLPSLIGVTCLPALRRGDRSPAFRIFGAQALGIATMQTLIATWLLVDGSASRPAGEPSVWPLLIVGLVAGVVAALVGWRLQPVATAPAPAPSVVPLALGPGERAAWMRMTSLPVPAVAVISVITIVMVLRAVVGWLVDRPGPASILTVVAVALVALLATTVAFHVRVDERGLTVRSVLGVPWFRVPLGDVGTVAVVDVRALGIIGSWGIRRYPTRTTIVMRPKAGIQVIRRSGGRFFVTVDDAATGAALLEALAARAAGASTPTPGAPEGKGDDGDG